MIRHALRFGGNHLLTYLSLSRFSFPHLPHHSRRYPVLPDSFALRWPKTSLGRRKQFPNQLRGTHPPTDSCLRQPDSTSRDLEALRALAQHTHTSLLYTYTHSWNKCKYLAGSYGINRVITEIYAIQARQLPLKLRKKKKDESCTFVLREVRPDPLHQ